MIAKISVICQKHTQYQKYFEQFGAVIENSGILVGLIS